MATIIGISGSTRRGSFNSSLLRALAAAAPPDTQVRIESIAAIPLYNVFDANGDITDAAVKESVAKFMAGFVAHVRNR